MLIPNKFNGYSLDGIRKYPIDFGIGEAALLGSAAAGAGEAAAGTGAALGATEGLGALGTLGATMGETAAGLGATSAGSLIPASVSELGAGAISAYTAALANGASAAEAMAAAQAAASTVATTAPSVVTPVMNAAATVPAAPPVTPGITSLPGAGSLGTPVEFAQEEFLAGQANQARQMAQLSGMNPADVANASAAQAAADQAAANLGGSGAYSMTAPTTGGGIGGFNPLQWIKDNPLKAAGLGLAGITTYNMLKKPNNNLPLFQPQTGRDVGLGATLASNYAPQRRFADGGLTAPGILALNNQYNRDQADEVSAAIGGLMEENMYPMSQQTTSRYAFPSQLPAGAHQVAQDARRMNISGMASGGISNLGSYSDGGRMLKGPGDGMSDDIPASIGGSQPARLADGEFVVPADVVSHLGNGSTDAGAKQLYSMMDKVRKARTGTKKQGRQIKPAKFMPA